MDLLSFAGVVVLIILIAAVAYLYYCGLFYHIEISTGSPFIRKATVAYKFAQGPYEESGRIFSDISRLAPKKKCIGLYYDNPYKISKHKLRYAAGVVLSEGEEKPDPEIQKRMVAEGFKIFELPDVSTHVRTTFPFKNMVSLMLAYRRVYPKIIEYLRKHKLEVKVMVEVYTEDKIQFMAPQERQDEYFIPEVIRAETDEHRNQ